MTAARSWLAEKLPAWVFLALLLGLAGWASRRLPDL